MQKNNRIYVDGSSLVIAQKGDDRRIPVDEATIRNPNNEKEPRHLVRSHDVENGHVRVEIDYLHKNYKDNQAPYSAVPLLVRIDTGKNTELRIMSDFLTWQAPNQGINDITLGMKWNFKKGNPSLGVLFGVEMPTGSKGIKAQGYEPAILFLMDTNLSKRWVYSANLGAVSNVDGTSLQRYGQVVYATGFTYHASQASDINLFFTGKTPDKYPGGTHLTSVVLGYRTNISQATQLNFHILRGLSSRDVNWEYGFGVGQRF